MTDRPVKGDNPDYNPRKTPEEQPKDDERNAPESGDKQPGWWRTQGVQKKKFLNTYIR